MRSRTRTDSSRGHDLPAVALVAAVGLALAAAGCGSSGSSSSSSSAAAPATTSTSTAPAGTSASATSTGKASSAGTTPAGTVLSPGATAVVNFEPESTNFRLQISVVSIKKGSQAEMSGVELDKAQRSQTPYYVTLRVQNIGSGNVGAHDVAPADEFRATDDRGGQAQELSVIGSFRPCESVTSPSHFTHGQTYQTCVVYMVGAGGSIAKVEWPGNGGDAYSSNPIVWKAG
jgi:hypothetical protein